MKHAIVTCHEDELLFSTWVEADALWCRLVAAVPRIDTLVLMPDHAHLLAPEVTATMLAPALRSYTQWRNHRYDEHGSLFEPLWFEPLDTPSRQQTVRRYTLVNPVRGGLVSDPLAWPCSTLRDQLGLALPPITGRAHDPDTFYSWICAHPAVPDGHQCALPRWSGEHNRQPTLDDVSTAVSALTRLSGRDLGRRGDARTLLLRSQARLTDRAIEAIAAHNGVHRNTVHRALASADARVYQVAAVLGDRRFIALDDDDLRRDPRWQRYLERARARRRAAKRHRVNCRRRSSSRQ